ncbi:MAG: hypothetical protein KDK54_19680 [Leptospiraceae bacterium]|nr:hypothetical protein [Leptospiraceae bacterium]
MKKILILFFLMFSTSLFSAEAENVNTPVDSISAIIGGIGVVLSSLGGQWAIIGKWFKKFDERHEAINQTINDLKSDIQVLKKGK